MKRIFAIFLAVVIILSVTPTPFAAAKNLLAGSVSLSFTEVDSIPPMFEKEQIFKIAAITPNGKGMLPITTFDEFNRLKRSDDEPPFYDKSLIEKYNQQYFEDNILVAIFAMKSDSIKTNKLYKKMISFLLMLRKYLSYLQ